jgi:3-hydroxyisobutyrate dehydrogenase-like beta-hydroxyacid dehydrogenase
MTKPKIGFMGLGMMGAAMVECLQKKGYAVTVLGNKNRAPIDAAIARGASEATTAKELAEKSDIIMLCMGTSEHVEGRMYGDDGVIAGLQNGAVVVDFGTSLPASTQKIGADVAQNGGTYLDAPLGRTPEHAVDGLLNIMCSGDKQAFDKIKPVLEDQGENVFHLGALGAGHSIKLINNFFGMTLASAMCEAFAIADKAGVDRQQLYDVMSAGPLHSPMMDLVKAYAVDGDINKLEFSVKNANKDVGYFQTMANDLGFKGMISPATAKTFDAATQDGFGEDNVPAILDYITKVNT